MSPKTFFFLIFMLLLLYSVAVTFMLIRLIDVIDRYIIQKEQLKKPEPIHDFHLKDENISVFKNGNEVLLWCNQ